MFIKLIKKLKSTRGNSLAEFAVTTAMMATLATTAAPKFGAVGAGAGLWKGGQAAIGSFKTGGIVRKSAEGIQRSGRGLVDATKTAGSRAVDIGRNLGQAGATYGQLGIEQAASALATKLGISIVAAKRLLAGTGIVGGGLGLNALLDDSEEPSFSGY